MPVLRTCPNRWRLILISPADDNPADAAQGHTCAVLVRVAGLEPARPRSRDFLTTLCRHSRRSVVVWIMSLPYPVGLRQVVYDLYTFMNTKNPSALSSRFRVVVVFTSCRRMDSFTSSIQFSSALSQREFRRISHHSLRRFPILVLWGFQPQVPCVCQFRHTRIFPRKELGFYFAFFGTAFAALSCHISHPQ